MPRGESPIKDEELVKQAQQGNEAAVELLIRHTYEDIYRFVRWKVHDPDTAWDLAQMTYEKVWSKLQTFEAEHGRFRTWLMSIASHVCIDHLRSKAFREGSLQQTLPEQIPVKEDFLDGILLREEVRQVYSAMEALQEAERNVLLLRYKRGLTFPEIARVTEESESAIKARFRRALIKLRNMLSPPGGISSTNSKKKENAHEG